MHQEKRLTHGHCDWKSRRYNDSEQIPSTNEDFEEMNSMVNVLNEGDNKPNYSCTTYIDIHKIKNKEEKKTILSFQRDRTEKNGSGRETGNEKN